MDIETYIDKINRNFIHKTHLSYKWFWYTVLVFSSLLWKCIRFITHSTESNTTAKKKKFSYTKKSIFREQVIRHSIR